jgi:hypothetical protein
MRMGGEAQGHLLMLKIRALTQRPICTARQIYRVCCRCDNGSMRDGFQC